MLHLGLGIQIRQWLQFLYYCQNAIQRNVFSSPNPSLLLNSYHYCVVVNDDRLVLCRLNPLLIICPWREKILWNKGFVFFISHRFMVKCTYRRIFEWPEICLLVFNKCQSCAIFICSYLVLKLVFKSAHVLSNFWLNRIINSLIFQETLHCPGRVETIWFLHIVHYHG